MDGPHVSASMVPSSCAEQVTSVDLLWNSILSGMAAKSRQLEAQTPSQDGDPSSPSEMTASSAKGTAEA